MTNYQVIVTKDYLIEVEAETEDEAGDIAFTLCNENADLLAAVTIDVEVHKLIG